MYKIYMKTKANGSVTITNHGAYFIKVDNMMKKIVQMDIDGNQYDNFAFLDINEFSEIAFSKCCMIISFKSGGTSFYSLNNHQMIFHQKETLSFIFYEENSQFIYMSSHALLYRYDKKKQSVEPFFSTDNKSLLLKYLINNKLIFTLKGGLLFAYKIEVEKADLSWRLDIRSLFPDEETVRINDIKEYQGSLIVATTAAVLRLSVEDGSIIWISEGYARTIEIVGNTGYVCTSGSLFKVNLDNGEESGFGWGEYHKLPNFTYNGKDYWATGHRVVYHDGLLWYSVYSSGDSFLIAINPENGNYEWIHYVDTIGKTDEPQFFGNYMFLYDTEHTLHIYQKES